MKLSQYVIPSELIKEILGVLDSNMFYSQDVGDGYSEDFNNDEVIEAKSKLDAIIESQDKSKL